MDDDLGINPSKYAERGIKNNKVAEQVLNAKLSNRQTNLRLVQKINSCENMNDKSCRRLYSVVYNEKNRRVSYCKSKNKSQQTVVKLYGFKETGSLCVKIKNWRMIIC